MRLLFVEFWISHLFDDDNHPVGGWAVELRSWLRGFRAKGVETAIATQHNASFSAEASGETQLLRVYHKRIFIPGLAYFGLFIPKLIISSSKYRPDFIIQAVAGLYTGLFWMLSRLLGVPFVYRCANDIDVDERYRDRLSAAARVLFRLGFERADGYAAQNQYQYRAIRHRFPNKPAIILHNPTIIRLDRPLPPREERHYVAWLGVFQHQKNLPLLARIAQGMPDTLFHIGGRSEFGLSHDATINALNTLSSLPNVVLKGYVTRREIPEFLGKSILLLNTSHYEGFSNTFLEAWSTGTPTVMKSAVDPDQLVQTHRLGLAADDDETMAAHIRTIIEMPAADYETLSERCLNYVRIYHDPEMLAGRFIDFLTGAVSRKSR